MSRANMYYANFGTRSAQERRGTFEFPVTEIGQEFGERGAPTRRTPALISTAGTKIGRKDPLLRNAKWTSKTTRVQLAAVAVTVALFLLLLCYTKFKNSIVVGRRTRRRLADGSGSSSGDCNPSGDTADGEHAPDEEPVAGTNEDEDEFREHGIDGGDSQPGQALEEGEQSSASSTRSGSGISSDNKPGEKRKRERDRRGERSEPAEPPPQKRKEKTKHQMGGVSQAGPALEEEGESSASSTISGSGISGDNNPREKRKREEDGRGERSEPAEPPPQKRKKKTKHQIAETPLPGRNEPGPSGLSLAARSPESASAADEQYTTQTSRRTVPFRSLKNGLNDLRHALSFVKLCSRQFSAYLSAHGNPSPDLATAVPAIQYGFDWQHIAIEYLRLCLSRVRSAAALYHEQQNNAPAQGESGGRVLLDTRRLFGDLHAVYRYLIELEANSSTVGLAPSDDALAQINNPLFVDQMSVYCMSIAFVEKHQRQEPFLQLIRAGRTAGPALQTAHPTETEAGLAAAEAPEGLESSRLWRVQRLHAEGTRLLHRLNDIMESRTLVSSIAAVNFVAAQLRVISVVLELGELLQYMTRPTAGDVAAPGESHSGTETASDVAPETSGSSTSSRMSSRMSSTSSSSADRRGRRSSRRGTQGNALEQQVLAGSIERRFHLLCDLIRHHTIKIALGGLEAQAFVTMHNEATEGAPAAASATEDNTATPSWHSSEVSLWAMQDSDAAAEMGRVNQNRLVAQAVSRANRVRIAEEMQEAVQEARRMLGWAIDLIHIADNAEAEYRANSSGGRNSNNADTEHGQHESNVQGPNEENADADRSDAHGSVSGSAVNVAHDDRNTGERPNENRAERVPLVLRMQLRRASENLLFAMQLLYEWLQRLVNLN